MILDNSSICTFKKNKKGPEIINKGFKTFNKNVVFEKNYWSIKSSHDGYLSRYGVVHERIIEFFPEKNTKSNHGELLRTIGFSSAPGLLRVFGITPDLMAVTFIGSAFWMLACMVVGVRAALDYTSLWRALGVVIVAWLLQAILLFSILVLFRNF